MITHAYEVYNHFIIDLAPPYPPRRSSDHPRFHRVIRLRSFHKDNTGDQSQPLRYYIEVIE